ncbi:MAG: hypothetical protein II497_00310 [Lachnospiraceae bacterium]|jgi:hypothetical protein|nr:hypothetical protein [Lachnospiraceae bacterium]MBQ4241360.1 hypothetical protein [Lachnospiraceae bacterium]MBQ5535040.1 hypothetical protein [Lachnospiraceae bacterium]
MDNNVNLNNQAGIPEEYKPISMWGYFGYELLFSIPCIGLIVLIVLAVSAKNVNVKNFARSYFCFLIILGILAGIAVATGAGALIASSM